MSTRIPPKWYTVPNFVEVTEYDRYHLFEGYCIGVLDEKPSGKHYKKFLIEGDYHQFLSWLGYSRWWEFYAIERCPLKRALFGDWKRK